MSNQRLRGDIIKALLFKKSMEQRELARMIGCSETWMSLVVRGHRTPSLELAEQIGVVLGTDVDFLLKD